MEEQRLKKYIEEIIERKAVNPMQGGEGEYERANYLQKILENDFGLKVKRYDIKDKKGYIRSNLIVEIGKGKRTVWILAHLDTVSEGDIKLWKYPPFKATFINGKVYGRGVSDNGIGIFSSLILINNLVNNENDLNYKVKFGFLADEEAGSDYGLKWLIENTKEFEKGSWAIVPDIGNSNGSILEIAEKGILWFKIEVLGEQTHGSKPTGKNANYHSMKFQTTLYEEIHKRFNKKNELFDPEISTFEPTKREKNVDGINIIPGKDISYWDCRILPEYEIEEVLSFIKEFADRYSKENKIEIKIEPIFIEKPSFTDPNSEFVKKFENSVKKALGIEPKKVGIGGGTLAGILRKIGIEAIAWGICSETEHKPNEYELIENYYKIAKVIKDFLYS